MMVVSRAIGQEDGGEELSASHVNVITIREW